MKIFLSFAIGCLFGLAVGYWAASGADSERDQSSWELDALEAQDDASRAPETISGTRDRARVVAEGEESPADASPSRVGEASGKGEPARSSAPIRRLVVERQGAGDPLAFAVLVLKDEEGRRMVAAPLEALQGARALALRGETGRRRWPLDQILARDPRHNVVFLGLASDVEAPSASQITAINPPVGAEIVCRFVDSNALTRTFRTEFYGGASEDDRGRLVLDRSLDREEGGVAFDKEGRALGLVLSRGGETAVLAPVTLESLRGAEQFGLSLDEYRRLYYEGTFDAWIAEAQRHLEARRFPDALRAFRAAHRLEPQRFDAELNAAWIAAHRGLIEALGSTASRARLRALNDALNDFSTEGDWEVAAARTAFSLEFWEESLGHWERADRLVPARVGDLDAAKTGVFRAWAEKLVEARRTRDAIDVLERALREVRGDAELLQLYGRLLLKIRDYAGASEALREALRFDPALETALADLIAQADRFTEGPGKVVIDYAPGQRSIIATVSLNDRVSGEFIVDTGATASFIPVALADRAGLDTSDRVPRVTVRTAGNERRLPYSPLDLLAVGGLSVRDINVIVGDLPGTGQRGLLGMDFLGKFGFENDAVNGRFVIYEKR
jgi:clan AA aspartic protease (TIGR02281 family)